MWAGNAPEDESARLSPPTPRRAATSTAPCDPCRCRGRAASRPSRRRSSGSAHAARTGTGDDADTGSSEQARRATRRPRCRGRSRAAGSSRVSGTITCSGENGRYESIATVRTCSATKNPTSSPPKRCTSSTANFGHLLDRALPAIVSPSASTIVSTTYAAIPAARAAYQSMGLAVRCTPLPGCARPTRFGCRRRAHVTRGVPAVRASRASRGRLPRAGTRPSRRRRRRGTTLRRPSPASTAIETAGRCAGRSGDAGRRRRTTSGVGHSRSSRRRLPAPAPRRRRAARRSPDPGSRDRRRPRRSPGPAMNARASSTASALTTPLRSS